MAAFAGLINNGISAAHPMTAGQALTGKGAVPMAAQANAAGSTSSTGSSATISSNDFLNLLVTEMKNQDPTANTDPNEYINQLVQVNSLEQLIDINQNLSTALGTSGGTPNTDPSSGQVARVGSATPAARSSTASPAAAKVAGAAGAHKAGTLTAANSGGPGTAAAISRFSQSAGANHAPGNLSIPAAKPAARSLAHALDGHHGWGAQGKLPVSQ